jgi:hypothetical protein
MGFFRVPDPAEDDDIFGEDDDEFEFDAPSSKWVGGAVPLELLVARSDQAAVVVRNLVAYHDGFGFVMEAFLHPSVKLGRRRRGPSIFHDPYSDGPLDDETLRFGISWPDGGRATNLDFRGRGWQDATEPAHGLESGSGGGSDREYSTNYWAWPLPAEGDLRFLAEWPAFDIPETAASLDARLLADAATRAFAVWPEGLDRPSHSTRAAMFRSAQSRSITSGESPDD